MSNKHTGLDPSIYAEVFAVSPQGLCVISEIGTYLDVNQTFAELLGYATREELIGMSIEDVTHPEDFEMDREMTEQIFSGEIDSFELDKRFIKKNGEVTWLRLHAKTYKDSLGIGVLEPITERIALESKIAKLKKDLDQFVYRVTHDLRSPIVNILGLAAVDFPNLEEARHLMEQAKNSAHKLDHIILEIADYAHNRKFPIKKEDVNLADLIDQVCETSQLERGANKRINIAKEVKHHNGVKVDQSRLNIVLKNLISNSLAFGKQDGHTIVSADVVESDLVVKIKDDGMGIRQDIQAKIYDMFFRGSNISQGAGLGLFIVKDILEEIDGEISFTSQEGEGTEFVVKIPLGKS